VLRGRSAGDQHVGLGLRCGVGEFQGGVEHGDPDQHRSRRGGQRVSDEVSNPARIQLGVEERAAITRRSFQMEWEAAYSVIIDSHRGEVAVVVQRKNLDVVDGGWNAVQLRHSLSLPPEAGSPGPPVAGTVPVGDDFAGTDVTLGRSGR